MKCVVPRCIEQVDGAVRVRMFLEQGSCRNIYIHAIHPTRLVDRGNCDCVTSRQWPQIEPTNSIPIMQWMSYRHIPFWIRQRIAHTKWYIFVRVAILVEPAAFSDQSYHDAVILIAYALDDLRPWRKTFQPFGGISGIRGATPIKNQGR